MAEKKMATALWKSQKRERKITGLCGIKSQQPPCLLFILFSLPCRVSLSYSSTISTGSKYLNHEKKKKKLSWQPYLEDIMYILIFSVAFFN